MREVPVRQVKVETIVTSKNLASDIAKWQTVKGPST
jgi:hypothetical protein